MKTKFRDIVIIVTILIIGGSGFFMFQNAFQKAKYGSSIVYYDGFEVAVVNFETRKISLKDQVDAPGYPILDEENETITVLGFPQDGQRHEVIIKYNFERKSMQIIGEQSPNNVCSNLGERNSGSLVCLPNRVEIIFRDLDGGSGFDGTI